MQPFFDESATSKQKLRRTKKTISQNGSFVVDIPSSKLQLTKSSAKLYFGVPRKKSKSITLKTKRKKCP